MECQFDMAPSPGSPRTTLAQPSHTLAPPDSERQWFFQVRVHEQNSVLEQSLISDDRMASMLARDAERARQKELADASGDRPRGAADGTVVKAAASTFALAKVTLSNRVNSLEERVKLAFAAIQTRCNNIVAESEQVWFGGWLTRVRSTEWRSGWRATTSTAIPVDRNSVQPTSSGL